MLGIGTLAIMSMALGAGFSLTSYGQIRAAARRRSWPKAAGTITHAEVLTHPGSPPFHTGVVRYVYALEAVTAYRGGDRQHQGRMESETSESPAPAQALLAKYRVGDRVEVFYDPARPSRSRLEASVSEPRLAKLFFAFGMIVSAIAGISLALS
ncbi:MAG: DUF3592 domain-containing protein [Labilithrix sp.]|nr:DUF3592 domain-containing protein [Labilithrix sp.]